MTIKTSSPEEVQDLKRRSELQATLQEAIRRSAPDSEIRKIQKQIEDLNQKLSDYATRISKSGT